MLENSRSFSSISQENSCSSISKHDSNSEPKMETNRDDSCKILESAHRSIADELIDDAILDVVFEVHRAAKHASTVAEKEKNSKNQQTKEQPITICCPICRAVKGTNYFTVHLTACMGGKRKARQKVLTFEETDDDSDDLGSDFEDFKPGSSRKRNKKGNKNSRKQSRLPGNSVSKQFSNANSNYQLMSHEEKRAFYDENCGVISKRTKRPCTKTLKCSQHTDEQRKDVRDDLMRNMGDQITNEEEIDVQSVDEDVSQQFIMPSSFTDI